MIYSANAKEQEFKLFVTILRYHLYIKIFSQYGTVLKYQY